MGFLTKGNTGADLGGGCRGCAPPPPEMTCGFLIQLAFCKKKKKRIQILASDYQIKNNKIKQYECEPINKKKRTAQSLHLHGHPDTL